MKNLVKTALLSLLLCLTLNVQSALIATAGSTPMLVLKPIGISSIEGQDTLRQACLASVAYGSRSVNSDSMDWSFAESFTYTNNVVGSGAEDVLSKLLSVQFHYRIKNSKDPIYSYVYLYDAVGRLLFYGQATYAANEKPQYSIWTQSIPILSNVQSAEVLALAEDGKTARHYPLTVGDGSIMFQQWMAGALNGILAVKFKDGTLTTYNLSNPTPKNPAAQSDVKEFAWKIVGHYVYPATETSKTVKIIETWYRPTVFIEVGTGEPVTFDVIGLVQMDGNSIFERPSGFHYEQQDGVRSGDSPLKDSPTMFTFPGPGKYRVVFDWDTFGKPGTIYTGPDGSDNGKGG